jgi:hypothetical protein
MVANKLSMSRSMLSTLVLMFPAEGHWAAGKDIIVDAAKARNCLALINDAKGFPGKGKKPNVVSFQILDHATSQLHIFFTTTRAVKKGEELLLDYSEVSLPTFHFILLQ